MDVLDQQEINKFAALAEDWWQVDGPMAPLHKINPVRLAYIREHVCKGLALDESQRLVLNGLRLLDVGCGCGLVSEPVARLGAQVTAIDPSERNIEVARMHATEVGLDICYVPADTGTLLRGGIAPFDVVTCLEVVEHSPAPDLLAHDLAELTRPGGILIMSTLNRTAESFVKAIIGAEYLLGWLPKGTHNWRRFVQPSQLAKWLRAGGFRVTHIQGMGYDPTRDSFHLSEDRSANYLLAAIRL